MRLEAGINDITYLILHPILLSTLGFEFLKVLFLIIPEELNTNSSKLRPFGRKQ